MGDANYLVILVTSLIEVQPDLSTISAVAIEMHSESIQYYLNTYEPIQIFTACMPFSEPEFNYTTNIDKIPKVISSKYKSVKLTYCGLK